MGAARASRDAVLPLWADHLGLHAATVSLVFGIGALADLICSYPAGQIMDRDGRRLRRKRRKCRSEGPLSGIFVNFEVTGQR
ncbi:hypothetical protein LT350_28975 [Mycolicibacterium smegmatis]|nr:hypothetical protein [Mycolicibacterium smegmatis]UGU30511.1 hypothetical protein LT350_28975 [Mycolicibacterium smegmatis]